jgi:hypothetical protein
MKIELPSSWFARILLIAWVLFLTGTLLLFLLASLAHSPLAEYLVTPLWILSIFVAVGTFAYAGAYAVRRLSYYLRSAWRRDRNRISFTLHPVERILAAGWLLFVVTALGALFFSRQKWVLDYGVEFLFAFFIVVILSSSAYGSYLVIRPAIKYLRR